MHRRVGLLLKALIIVIPLAWVGVMSGRYFWAEHHLRAAKDCLERRDFANAQAHLQRCLEIRSGDKKALFLSAQTARRAGALDEADQSLARCAEMPGMREKVAFERLLLRAQQGQTDASAESVLWSAVEDRDANAALILEALSQGYLHTYRLHDALSCLDRW